MPTKASFPKKANQIIRDVEVVSVRAAEAAERIVGRVFYSAWILWYLYKHFIGKH